jgi:hypothetical protein
MTKEDVVDTLLWCVTSLADLVPEEGHTPECGPPKWPLCRQCEVARLVRMAKETVEYLKQDESQSDKK